MGHWAIILGTLEVQVSPTWAGAKGHPTLVLREVEQDTTRDPAFALQSTSQPATHSLCLSVPLTTNTYHHFCRLCLISMYGFLIRTYKNDGFGSQWYGCLCLSVCRPRGSKGSPCSVKASIRWGIQKRGGFVDLQKSLSSRPLGERGELI